jgi:hypothetical protein
MDRVNPRLFTKINMGMQLVLLKDQMNPLSIGSQINPDTKVMTIHYDGCEIRVEPILFGVDSSEERRIDFRIYVDGIAIEDARNEEPYDFTFHGKSKINHIKFRHIVFQKAKSEKLDFDLSKILFTINDIPVRHTKRDPMEKIGQSLIYLKILLGFNIIIVVSLLIQKFFIDAFLYSFIVSMGFLAILSFKKYHFFGLIFGTSVCLTEMVLTAFGIAINQEITTKLFILVVYVLQFRFLLLYHISAGIISAWKLSRFNKRLHAELASKSY